VSFQQVSAYENQPDFVPQAMLRSIERIQSGILNHIITPEFNFKVHLINLFVKKNILGISD
jgi:hypothetical protein